MSMNHRIPPVEMAGVLAQSLDNGFAATEDTSVVYYDLDRIRARALEAVDAFPSGALHAVAVKANPLPPVLKVLAELHPAIGLEAASLPELRLALNAGFAPERILFDSPAKTEAELHGALEAGVHLNIDNFQELDRIARWVQANGLPAGGIGLRVNPVVGEGAIASTSVAGAASKFGVPLDGCRGDILAAYTAHPWLTALHAHVGSQGCSLGQLAAGACSLLDLAREINASIPGRINTIDIGGGLPATYDAADPKPSISDYAATLAATCPELLNGDYRICTEFGRAIHANAAFAASRVEYVKRHGGAPLSVIHLGADMFLRPCYNPADWRHDVLAATPDGTLKDGPDIPQRVAGPLCFQGDFPARNAHMPELAQGDWVLIRDVGAYTLSMWSRYNSRQIPTVLGFERSENEGTNKMRFRVLRKRESVEDVLRFWE